MGLNGNSLFPSPSIYRRLSRSQGLKGIYTAGSLTMTDCYDDGSGEHVYIFLYGVSVNEVKRHLIKQRYRRTCDIH